MARLIDGTAPNITPLEQVLITLVRKTCLQPAALNASDLEPLRDIVGDDALDYALVLGSFHFINRMADLLDVPAEALPKPLRKFETLRRLSVRLGSRMMARMDLATRTYPVSYKAALEHIRPLLAGFEAKAVDHQLQPLKSRPKLIEALQLALEERDIHSGLDRETLARIHRVVEASLPATIEQVEGHHARPADPVDSFAFVGTRFAYRTTAGMIGALRQQGYDDIGILDLAIAVAEANQWARFHRLLDLNPALYYRVTGAKA